MSRLIFLLIILGFTLLGCAVKQKLASSLSTRELKVGSDSLIVEVADNFLTRAQGLSGRAELADGSGMLFVFSSASVQNFWMKGMNFPLDFLWLKNNKVVQLTPNVPNPTKQSPEPARISSRGPVDMVIEVPAGWIIKHGVRVGMEVQGLP